MIDINDININTNFEVNSNILFIDSNIDNYQTLISGANNAQVILLDSSSDGIEQITETLSNYHQIDSIHILSHGEAGSLQLGSTNLNTSNLSSYSKDLATWSDSLKENGDILFYGCNVAAGITGIDFVNNFSKLTNADVAASDDLTGNSQLGGDWDLEVTVGNIEANLAIDAATRNTYQSILPTYNGKEYLLTNGVKSWEQAQAEAESLGGNLVTINNSTEETWLKQTFGENEGFWIGINDRRVEGQFEWASGETVTYTNWYPGEPNNGGGSQDFGWINYGRSRQWDDHFPTARLRGIIEIDNTTTPNLGSNIVTNGSFENNPIAVNRWGLVTNLPGWSPTIQSVIEVQELTNRFGNADDGTAWVELDSRGNGGIIQNLQTTVNSEYQLSFAYSPRANVSSASNGIAVYWDGQLIDTISRSGGSSNSWQTYTYNVSASDNSTPLEFRAIGNSDRLGAYLDDVEVRLIDNQDNPGVIKLETNNYQVNETDGTVDVIIERTQGSDGTVTVDYQTFDATATAEDDYSATTGTVTFADGETRKAVTIPILDDSLAEGRENFSFTIDNIIGGATLLAPRTALVNILDNETGLEPILDFDNFADTTPLTLNGNATQAGNALRLTSSQGFQVGSAFFDRPLAINASTSFETQFQFQLSGGSGGADGFTFMLQNSTQALNALGFRGGDLGYGSIQDTSTPGISQSLAIEFDTYQNGWDINNNHISINPFYNGDPDSNRSKVYQLGLRNPFRITVDPRNGDLYVGDVGWTQWEEINSAGAGANFGWPYYEGGNGNSLQTGGYRNLAAAQAFYASNQQVTPSLLGLNHGTTGINAIVLGDIYTDNVFPEEYQGDLFFNDLGQGIVRNVSFDELGNVTSVDTFATGANVVVQIIEGPDGKLYYVDLDDGQIGRWFFS